MCLSFYIGYMCHLRYHVELFDKEFKQENYMLRIVLKDGNIREYKGKQFTDYEWKKEVFIVINGNQWIAMFNWDCVKEVLFLDEE